MDKKDTDLLVKLRGLFAIEAEERRQAIATGLLALEKGPEAEEEIALLETLFREVHTLKGAARAVNLSEIEAICQVVESVCAPLKRKELKVWPELFDTLHRAMDTVQQLSVAQEGPVLGQVPALMAELVGLEAQGRAQAAETVQEAEGAVPEEPPVRSDAEPLAPATAEAASRRRSSTASRSPTQRRSRAAKKPPAATETESVAPEAVVSLPEEIPAAEDVVPTPSAAEPPPDAALTALPLSDDPAGDLTQAAQEQVAQTPIVEDCVLAAEETVVEEGGESLVPVVAQPPVAPDAPRPLAVQTAPQPSAAAPTFLPSRNGPTRRESRVSKKQLAQTETVRIAAAKLDALFLQAEEMLAVKLKTSQHAAELREVTAMLDAWKREWVKVHTDIRRTQRFLEKEESRTAQDPIYAQATKLVEFLDWTHDHLKVLDKALKALTTGVVRDQQALGSMVDILLDDAKKVLMLPFSSALEVLPKMVRDLSRAQEKDVELVLQGGEVEIDKRILEEMKDPLIHLLRNCTDHGIEKPAERERHGKPPQGTIGVSIAPAEGNLVEMVIADDGAGIDVVKVKEAAVKCGVLARKAAETLSDQEAISLIFQSEVSTSPVVSNISGRGLGMAIVREKIEKLGGQIAVETQRYRGTLFRIRLPLTLATFRGILVQAAGQTFVVPTANVERVVRVKHDEIRTVGNQETIVLAGHTVALLRLDQALGIPRKARSGDRPRFQPALVLSAAEKHIAFGVDAVVNEQEVLFKSLGRQLARVRNVAGATVLGSGQVVPILNVADLVTSAVGGAVASVKTTVVATEEDTKRKSVLVAEDSITSRMLLKEILESAGYAVSTAIDGADAFASLQKADFDLVVSDIEMPRLNGFDLTAKIRGDEKHASLPVVLVTGLESQADRERGIDAGANA
ncbi:MAG: hybrid sensor histidine kinase/response regulator, partial [Deltaproteobacteria bacterium]|nr:hybrid sensor histidine kinase/response regulator [Deltaproteobacteria bacterium]